MSWQAASFVVLGLVLAAGFAWYERDKPPARVLSLVATLAALAVVGRLAFAAVPNVKPTTDIVLFAGYALGGVPGFAVGAVTALVSNVFLSQGPWTPWQMVGWGAVGVAGALLARALRGREPNRWLLAAVCGAAGLAFGAWMDLYQLTLAAHQDFSTYLALSATSLPYNLAHAGGNVVFCLLIGPVFIRALRRYRRRFEVRWATPAVAAVLLLMLPAVAVAATPAERAERWLVKAQNRDGGFGGDSGQSSSELFSGWAGLGLAAAERNPRDVKRRRGRSLATYVRKAEVRDIGEIERTVLLLEAAGLSPRDFGGRDLVAAIESRRRRNGSFAGFVSYTAFGVLALKAAGVPAGERTIGWLLGSQGEDGGFGLTRSSASDADMTGATLQALATVGRAGSPAARRAVRWLRSAQNGDGGWGQFKGRSSNAQSTSYAVQGLVAVGAGGGRVARALAYLRKLQRDDGSVAYSSSSTQTPVWVTAQALLAFERAPLPIAAVPRRPKPAGGEKASGGGGSSGGTDESGGGDGDGGGSTSGSGGSGSADSGSSGDGSGSAADSGSSASGSSGSGSISPGSGSGTQGSSGSPGDSPLALEESITVDKADPRRAAAEDGGAGSWGWIAAGAVCVLLALAWVFRRRLPRPLRRDDPVA